MIRYLLPLLLAVAASPAAAQLSTFDIFPQAGFVGVNTASRGNFGPGDGSLFQGYPPSHFRGIGDDGTSCTVHGFQYLVQDQDTATSDPYTWAIRSGTAAGPTLGAGGLLAGLATATPLSTGGPGAWLITLTPTSPIAVPCNDHFFVGFQFPAFAAWPTSDGPSGQARTYAGEGPVLTGQPHHTWQFIGTPDTGAVSQTSARVWAISVRTPCPTLSVGALGWTISPNFGAPGMYTKVALPEALGITFRVRDAANPNGAAIILFGTAYDPSFGLGGFGIKGRLWLTAGLIGQLHAMTLGATGEAIGGPAWMGAGQLHRFGGTNAFVLFQAITYTPPLGNVRAANAAGTRLF
jgi:hypothetical protein